MINALKWIGANWYIVLVAMIAIPAGLWSIALSVKAIKWMFKK